MKKNFFKTSWASLVVVLLFIALAVTSREPIVIVLAVAFAGMLWLKYRNYNPEEQDYDDWWGKLSVEEKADLHNTKNKVN